MEIVKEKDLKRELILLRAKLEQVKNYKENTDYEIVWKKERIDSISDEIKSSSEKFQRITNGI